MRVEIDIDRCALSALCTALAPEVFDVDDPHVVVAAADIGEAALSAAVEAANACPTGAITVTDTLAD
ncbi:ferredoxin [Mycobacteroides abscessus]|uniref:ferredoxin n=1 Tax=Mycobacteroides abscessus TaxID=36809 RepID=UPI0003858AA5|nr:ferredoxin [Mycobacteroides abscessus]EPZ18390.1 hypothetical protein M879_21445 [Mycobacteroides abscessus V06705]